MSERFVTQIEPEEAFALLADETRLGILRAIWDADVRTVTFTELRRAVGMRDPGQFNYHLNKLVGRFVVRTDEGYRLTQTGKQVNGAIASGMYTAHESLDPIALDHRCRRSGEQLTLRYERETVRIECESCPVCPSGWEAPVPPVVFAGHDSDEIPEAVSRYFRTKVRQAVNGFCPYCSGRMESTVTPFDAADHERLSEDRSDDLTSRSLDPAVWFDCRQCGAVSKVALDHALLLTDPVVANFHRENRISVRGRSIWELSELGPDEIDLESRHPLRVAVTFRVDESTLTVVVDGAFEIVDIEA